MNALEAHNNLLQYVLEHEQEDFYENPSESHIYYSALVICDGETLAKEEVKRAIKDIE